MIVKKTIYLCIVIFIFFSHSSKGQTKHITNDEGYEIEFGPAGFNTSSVDFNPERLFTKSTWSGDWIWLNPSLFSKYQETQIHWIKNPRYQTQYKVLFRKNFELSSLPNQVIMSISADVSYRVFINGIFIAQGPPNIGNDYFDGVPPTHWFSNTHNIKKYLARGTNTIAVEVYSHSREISETSSGHGKLICDIDDEVNKNIVSTDTTWKCTLDTSFVVHGGNFNHNSNFEITNWSNKITDDASWDNASIKNHPKNGYLITSKIPIPIRHPVVPKRLWLPKNEIPVTNISSAAFNKAYFKEEFTLDYDRNLTAYYGFEIEAHKNDTLKIFPFEKRYAATNRTLTFVCKEGVNIFYAPYLSVFRYLKVEVISAKGLIVKNISADFSSYPVSYIGKFISSDKNLTRLWDITRWTTQLCMNDMFYDSPNHQEPIACTGDYFIQSLINYYAFGDPWLTRQTLLKTAYMLEKNNYDMFHTSYSLIWVQMIHQYYQYTGDLQLVKEILPHVNRLNQLFESYLDEDNLVSNAPDYMFMDWIKIDKFNAHHPPAVIGMGYMTAFYYKSLVDAAYLNMLAGNTSISDKNLFLAEKIKAAMNTLLWDQGKKLYKDGLPFRSKTHNHFFFPPDTNIITYSPHVNTLAVLYDIVPKDQQLKILHYVVNQKAIDLQPYFMFFVLSAVDHARQFNTVGLELLKKWEGGINLETYTLKENWQDQTETGYGGDYSHAWGGSPLYFMSRNILGVKPGTAGFKEIEINLLRTSKIKWAKGIVPLEQGRSMAISWERQNKRTYNYSLEIPADTKTFVTIPIDWRKNGFKINNTRYPKGISKVYLLSGIHKIEF